MWNLIFEIFTSHGWDYKHIWKPLKLAYYVWNWRGNFTNVRHHMEGKKKKITSPSHLSSKVVVAAELTIISSLVAREVNVEGSMPNLSLLMSPTTALTFPSINSSYFSPWRHCKNLNKLLPNISSFNLLLAPRASFALINKYKCFTFGWTLNIFSTRTTSRSQQFESASTSH